MVNVSNFLTTLFWQLLTLAMVSLTIYVTRYLLPTRMQKCPSVNTRNIFQSNLGITTHSSLSCLPAGIRRNLRIVVRSSLSCPLAGIRRNLHIAAHSSLSSSPVGIRCTLLFRSSSMLLPGKTILADAWVFQRGLLFLFVHWFNEGCCVEGGEIGEEVRFV